MGYFLKINESRTMKWTRRQLSNDMVINGAILKNNQITLFPRLNKGPIFFFTVRLVWHWSGNDWSKMGIGKVRAASKFESVRV